MKTILKAICYGIVLMMLASCGKSVQSDSHNEDTIDESQNSNIDESATNTEMVTTNPNGEDLIIYSPVLLPEERDSITMGELSSDHVYYQEVVDFDPDCVNYIKEMSIYDKEIDDTFIVHISLPPNYTSDNKYPMVVMTDGVWRLSDHPEMRQLMINGEIEEVILVSVGYPNDYNYRRIRERDLIEHPDSYLHFMVDNLVPYLCENYSIDTERLTVTGHSYGGYWAFYSLFNSDTIGKNTFANYYIGSPFLETYGNDMGPIYDFEKAYYSRNKELNANVYITVGEDESQDFGQSFIDSITDFVNLLSERNYEGFNCKYEIIPDYDHNTVFKPSIRNTLKMYYGID